MNPDRASVAMLCTDPHPAHRGFANAVDATCVDFRRRSAGPLAGTLAEDILNGLTYPSADVYIVEGSQPLYAGLLTRLRYDAKVVYLCADHGLYDLGRGDFEGNSLIKSLVGRFGTPVVRTVARHGIDGVVAVSAFAAEFTRDVIGEQVPLEIAHPYVQPSNYDRLGGVSPSLDDETVVTVGRGARYKGVDMLVEAWPLVRQQHPDATLHVVGAGHPDSYETTPGVRVRGFVEDLPAALAEGALYVQPSRMDTFPVATLEAMCAGLPPLVTETTGTRSEARAIDDSLVVSPDPSALADGIVWYLNRSDDERGVLSSRARERGQTFDEVTRTAAFRRAFRTVLQDL
jgi:glycosyltransferase involved in cell wall biosynthesis